MKVGLAYTDEKNEIWLDLDVEENSTVEQVIETSGLLNKIPNLDLESRKVGIFGKFTRLTAKVSEGDRVEIYRPITRVLDEDDDDDDDD